MYFLVTLYVISKKLNICNDQYYRIDLSSVTCRAILIFNSDNEFKKQ